MKKKQLFIQEQKTLSTKWNRYKGKIVAVMGDKIFTATTGAKAKIMIQKLEKKHGRPPLVTYVPKADTLILFLHGH